MKLKIEYGLDGMSKVFLLGDGSKIQVSRPFPNSNDAAYHAHQIAGILECECESVQVVKNEPEPINGESK